MIFIIKSIIFIFLIYQFNYISILGVRIPSPKCNEPLNIYENLDCNPIYSVDKNGHKKLCPDCFDCSQINPVVNKCYYEGRYYPIGEEIGNECTNVPNCHQGCLCMEDLTFSCPMYKCAMIMPSGDCNYYSIASDGCCPSWRCRDNNTLTCNVNGETYYEGQYFPSPNDPCSTCLCTQGVSGELGDPHCKKTACSVEFYESNHILGYCAPVYSTVADCCPYTYICPRDDDIFTGSCGQPGPKDSHETHPQNPCANGNCKQCRYGKKYYDIGTRFKRVETYENSQSIITKCECRIPPYFTCIQNS